MTVIRYTLAPDGARDRLLLHPIEWLLRQVDPSRRYAGTWADLRGLPRPPRNLGERIELSCQLYPCEILLVHRDAESEGRPRRLAEIAAAARAIGLRIPHLAVIPVRMTEAWFLFDEAAIRRAAGHPAGTSALDLPGPGEVEQIDAKRRLDSRLCLASGLAGRHLKRFDRHAAVHRVAELTSDDSPLLALPSFAALASDLAALLPGLPRQPARRAPEAGDRSHQG